MSNTGLPDLAQSLQGRDLGHLQIVAGAWELDDFNAPDARLGLQRLLPQLLNPQRFQRITQELDDAAQLAFNDLLHNNGRLPWALFIRRYGELREMGLARRDRERPHLSPASATEALWYRGLIGRSFFDSPAGPEEFAYIPADYLEFTGSAGLQRGEPLGKLASSTERSNVIPANDQILDHACTYLAGIRSGQFDVSAFANWNGRGIPQATFLEFLRVLLSEAGCLDPLGLPIPEGTRDFLEKDRGAGLAFLFKAWTKSTRINDLRLAPGLVFEGEWENDPLHTRQVLLDFILSAPEQQSDRPFISLASFVWSIYKVNPDFQRPAGDYDSWFIRDRESNKFLRGFEHWDDVDGALIRFLIVGPLHWLGIIDLSEPSAEDSSTAGRPSAFRLSAWAASLLGGKTPPDIPLEKATWKVRSNGRIVVPRLSARSARYQIARFCESKGVAEDSYVYQLTPASLRRAQSQGLHVSHLLSLMSRQSKTLPPTLVGALERWEDQGSTALFERAVILRVKSPEILQMLRTGRAARYLGDPLGPTTVIVKSGAIELVANMLLEMGYLSEMIIED
ncbi:MAG: hypothetical protein H6Q37_1136 [Chloroflexi bacterium]|nr:hypothetical protein [Chloroflexota bacterium]